MGCVAGCLGGCLVDLDRSPTRPTQTASDMLAAGCCCNLDFLFVLWMRLFGWLPGWVCLLTCTRRPTRPTQTASVMRAAWCCCNLVFWCSHVVSCAEVLQALAFAVWLAAWVSASLTCTRHQCVSPKQLVTCSLLGPIAIWKLFCLNCKCSGGIPSVSRSQAFELVAILGAIDKLGQVAGHHSPLLSCAVHLMTGYLLSLSATSCIAHLCNSLAA
jgi:hypothetical protein